MTLPSYDPREAADNPHDAPLGSESNRFGEAYAA